LFKRLQENGRVGAKKATSMTEERIDMLNAIDFVWDIQDAQFEVYLMMYRKYKEEHGHGKVPKLHGKEGLGRWVGSQRTLLRRGKMSVSRFLKLKEAGFEWHSHTCGNYDIAASLAKMEMKAKGMKAKA
jgi:Helicase associated domain